MIFHLWILSAFDLFIILLHFTAIMYLFKKIIFQIWLALIFLAPCPSFRADIRPRDTAEVLKCRERDTDTCPGPPSGQGDNTPGATLSRDSGPSGDVGSGPGLLAHTVLESRVRVAQGWDSDGWSLWAAVLAKADGKV